jgi:hypothetical protein
MGTASQSMAESGASVSTRWVQLAVGIVGMVAIANLQYGWTLFVNPIDSKFHWGKAAIQVAFTLFVLAETWLVPIEGYLVDRFGPRWLVAVGGGPGRRSLVDQRPGEHAPRPVRGRPDRRGRRGHCLWDECR